MGTRRPSLARVNENAKRPGDPGRFVPCECFWFSCVRRHSSHNFDALSSVLLAYPDSYALAMAVFDTLLIVFRMRETIW
jgi:hypothetical protein